MPGLCTSAVAAGLILSLVSCAGGTGGGRSPDFRSARSLPPLTVPPDLIAAPRNNTLTVPEPQSPAKSAPAAEPVVEQPVVVTTARSRASLHRSRYGVPALTVEQQLDRAWQEVGRSLTDLGIAIETQDRDAGIYYIQYLDPQASSEQGWFKRLVRRKPKPQPYQVRLLSAADNSIVTVHDAEGKLDKSDAAQRILTLLHDQLR